MPVLSTNPYADGRAPMILAAVAYAPPDNIPTVLTNATHNEWQLVWGPSERLGNQMYVAHHTKSGFFAIAIRGTVVEFSLAFFENWYDDLEVGSQVQWPYCSSCEGAMIAQGAMDGLGHLTGMTSDGLTILDFFHEKAPEGSHIIVTGHSLGASLTSVLAPWLKFQLRERNSADTRSIMPFTFAAPTAGNQAFVRFYNETFHKTSWRYWNTLDIVPRTWADLPSIKELYRKPGPECPWEVKAAVDGVNALLTAEEWWEGSRYVQTNDNGSPLQGTPQVTGDWFTEIIHQHSHNTYLKLLGVHNPVPLIDS